VFLLFDHPVIIYVISSDFRNKVDKVPQM
jgi:hypothetical protein